MNEDLDQMKEILAEATIKIYQLEKKIEFLLDTQYRREEWTRQAKRDAGYSDNISFDVVWKETLAKSKLSDNISFDVVWKETLAKSKL